MSSSIEKLNESVQEFLAMMESSSSWAELLSSSQIQRNPLTEKTFDSFNQVNLSTIQSLSGYSSPYWATFEELKSAGLWIKKSEVKHGRNIFYYKFSIMENLDTGERIRYPELKSIQVFNADQLADPQSFIDYAKSVNFDAKVDKSETLFEDLMSSLKVETFDLESQAIPSKESFSEDSAFFSTVFSQLSRLFTTDSLSSKGASNELVTELTATMLCKYFGYTKYQTERENGIFISNFKEVVRDNPAAILSACSAADETVNHIVGKYSLAQLKKFSF